MTGKTRLLVGSCVCLVAGVADLLALGGWAVPRALAERERERQPPVAPASVPPPPPAPVKPPEPVAAGDDSAGEGMTAPAEAQAPSAPSAPSAAAVPAPGSGPAPARPSGPLAVAAVRIDADEPRPHDDESAGGGDAAPALVLFATGSAHWGGTGDQTIAALVERARTRPDLVVDIEGHTDRRGEDHVNARLSLQRARAVAAAFRAAGISTARLRLHGYGASRPRADVAADGRRALRLNRRVEIRVHSEAGAGGAG